MVKRKLPPSLVARNKKYIATVVLLILHIVLQYSSMINAFIN